MKISLFNLTVFLCAASFLFACRDLRDLNLDLDQITHQELEQELPDDGTFVSAEQAVGVAGAFFNRQSEGAIVRSTLKTDVSIETVYDERNRSNSLMYIVNYPEGGWAIISATRNCYPVLAYSDEGSFLMKAPENMGSVVAWLEESKEYIRESEAFDDSIKCITRSIWRSYERKGQKNSPGSLLKNSSFEDAYINRISALRQLYTSDGWYFYRLSDVQYDFDNYWDWYNLCSNANNNGSPPQYTIIGIKNYYSYNQVGPFLTTKWGQNAPFNNKIPNKCYVGCIAVAMGQIMKYHQKPDFVNTTLTPQYNWNDMPAMNIDSMNIVNSSIPFLLFHIGIQANIQYCTSSGSTSNIENARFAFVNSYNYNSQYTKVVTEHKINEVRNEISAQRPVLMYGETDTGAGHAWVAHGIKDETVYMKYFVEYINAWDYSYSTLGYSSYSYPLSTLPKNYNRFFMNWGHAGLYDGLFFDNWANMNSNYDFKKERQNLYVRKN